MKAALPIINISTFLNPDSSPEARLATAQSVHEACTNFGFFYLTGIESIVPQTAVDEALRVTREFFSDTPQEEKELLRIGKGDGARGYQVLGENVTQYKADWHEALDTYCPVVDEDPTQLLRGPNKWPTRGKFRSCMEEWVEKMKIVGMALLEATALGLGLDLEGEEWRALKASGQDSFWVLRNIGYPPLPASAPGVSCGQHKDYGLWTLLTTDETKGALQVYLNDPEGKENEGGHQGRWIDASPIKGCIVVNIGEMWEILTNGSYKATLHRVLHKSPNYRISIPFFYEPSWSTLVAPIPSLLARQIAVNDPEANNVRKSILYSEHLKGKVSGNFTPAEISAV